MLEGVWGTETESFWGMVEMRVEGRERGMEVRYGRDGGTGEGEGDGGLVW